MANIEFVEKLTNEKWIVRIKREVVRGSERKTITKYTIADQSGIVHLLDLNGELTGIQFFDWYSINELGDIIIGIKKDWEEYYKRVLSHFDLSDAKLEVTEAPGGPFNIGPYAKQYYDYKYPTKMIEDIIPQSYSFNYGLINRNGVLTIYPTYDCMEFSSEDTCRVGKLENTNLKFGYHDVLSGDALTPVCFDEAKDFSEGKAVVEFKNRYGYIDRQKIMRHPDHPNEYANNLAPKFFKATSFEEGIAIVITSPSNPFSPSIRAKVNLNGDIVEVLLPNRVLRKEAMHIKNK